MAAVEKPKTIRLADYRAPDFLVETLDLTFELEPKATRVTARSAYRRNPVHKGETRPLVLDGEDMKLVSVSLDGRTLPESDYKTDKESLTVATVPDAFELTVVTEIAPEDNTRLEGLYLSNGIYTTQCEAEGFRRITYFPDRPDVMAKYRVTVRADRKSCPVLLSNGNLVSEKELSDGRHEAVFEDPYPKPSYLFALVAGDLAKVEEDFTTETGREVKLRIFVEHGNEGRCGFAMDALKRSMRWDEEEYGLAYDLDQFSIVAVSDFNM